MEIREMISITQWHQWILLGAFLAAFLIQMSCYLLVYLKLPLYKPAEAGASDAGVSVIVCARNEESNLKRFLPLILEQDHPQFEVVVVNDSSTDQSEDVLNQFSALYTKLRHTSIPASDKHMRGKKLAVTLGLKAARFDRVLLTDADCYPLSKQWLKGMSAHLTGEKRIVLGYGGYEPRRGLLNKLIRYETVFTAMQYLSFAIKGKPYMGVGRNLAYDKSLFF
jgi:biofilm PGA synthesis N-glycosyltransferase PgaC